MNYNHNFTEFPFSEALMDKIMNHIIANVLVFDRLGNTIYCNDNCLELYQCSREELFSRNCFDAYKNGFIDRETAAADCIRTKKEVIRHARTATGQDIMVHCQPVLDDQGGLEFVVASAYVKDAFIELTNMMNSHQENLTQSIHSLTDTNQNYVLDSENKQMKRIYAMAHKSAQTDSTIIIYGESGVGKEIMAKAIHNNSRRNSSIFLPVNCASIPSELIESELFGYERGAFTGARGEGKAGLFEMANDGTIFLDEIGDFPLYAQAKLLRVLESGAARRIGGDQERQLNVRTIAATNRDLKSMVEEGAFREDLYYRLNILPLNILPLRERTEDIMNFARCYLDTFNKKYGYQRYFAQDIEQKLTTYQWPGNIRELRNTIERIVISAEKDKLTTADLWFLKEPSYGLEDTSALFQAPLKDAMLMFERAYIQHALAQEDGNISETANRIGIHRTNLYKTIKRLDIQP